MGVKMGIVFLKSVFAAIPYLLYFPPTAIYLFRAGDE